MFCRLLSIARFVVVVVSIHLGLSIISSIGFAASGESAVTPLSQDEDGVSQGGEGGAETNQEDGDAETQEPAEDWRPLLAEWKELELKLKSTADDFVTASTEPLRNIHRRAFDNYLADANGLLPRLKDAAVAAYKADPNSDEELVELLVGMMVNFCATDSEQADFDVQAMELGELLVEHGVDDKHLQAAANAIRLGPSQREIIKEIIIRRDQAAGDMPLPQVKLTIEDSEGNLKGEVLLELFEDDAPNTVASFISLVEKGFYNGLTFHRVIDGYMAQGGCPDGVGTGGPGYTFADEFDNPEFRRHFAGSLSMANGGPDSNGSQFFITFVRTMQLDNKHTVFGRVIEGMDVVNGIQRRNTDTASISLPDPDKIRSAEVIQKRDHPYEPVVIPDPSEDTNEGEGEGEDTGDGSDGGTGDDADGGSGGSDTGGDDQ